MQDPITKLEKLVDFINDNSVSQEDITKIVELILEAIVMVKADLSKNMAQNNSENDKRVQDVLSGVRDMELRLETSITNAKKSSLGDFINVSKEINSEIKRLEKLIPKLEDIADISDRLFDVEERIEAQESDDESENRLTSVEEQVNTFKKLVKEIKNTSSSQSRVGWGAHPLLIKDDGAVIDKVARIINFTGGNVTRDRDGTINVPVGGGGTWLTPTGTVNGSNTVFTVATEPTMVVSDGMCRVAGFGYTYSSGEITMDIAPQDFIRYM
jgi:hypothetical protein